MANVEWIEIPFTLTSPAGTVLFNQHLDGATFGPQWILDTEKCQAGSAKRVTRDNSPQQGGEIIHRKFKTGFVIQVGALAVNFRNKTEMVPLCGSDLVGLYDALILNLDAIENADGRMQWTPSGHASRMVDAARWLGPDGQAGGAFTSVLVERESSMFVSVQFALVSPFPYAMDLTQTISPSPSTHLTSGGSMTLNNAGTTNFYPVVEVYGPCTTFTITNATTGQALVYNGALPGAAGVLTGHHIEFDFFRNTAYFDGAGANAKPGIDVLNSDFWFLQPGSNVIQFTSDGTGSMQVLWQAAYA